MSDILRRLALAGAVACGMLGAQAEEPIITFHTNVYDNVGETNAFHFYLGATESTYFDIDCGFGTFETEVGVASFDSEAGGIAGTAISCTVSSEGMVRIYGDASKIDYIDMEGCYISDISFPGLTNVEILNLAHNELKALDLSHMTRLKALYLSDNPFSVESPLVIGKNKPGLYILEMSIIDHLDPSFDLADYPAMRSFEAWHVPDLTRIDPTRCPDLLRLSVDVTNISSVDVSKNPSLLILNVSETKVQSLDLSNNPLLTELYCGHRGQMNNNYKMAELNLGSKPELQRLYCQGNKLTTLDISGCPKLINFSCEDNELTTISLDANPDLASVNISLNRMGFSTMPMPRETFSEYYYFQKDLTVDRSYAVGSTLDFSSKVLREGTETQAYLYAISEENPGTPSLLEPEYYTYADGKVTLNQVVADSVMIMFANSAFPEYPLSTAKFKIKTPEEMGQPTAVAEMTFYPTVREVSFGVGIQGATPESPKTFIVDFGSGTTQEFTATTNEIPAVPNVSGARKGRITIYMPEGTDISALDIEGLRLMSVDLAQARTLGQLSITDCQLPTIDLTWNRCLTKLDLSGNNLGVLDLSEPNGNYGKNVLADIKVARNRLTSVSLSPRSAIRTLDLSENNLATFDLTKLDRATTIDLSGNQLTEVDLRDLEAIKTLRLSDNYLSSIALLDYLPLENLDISGNQFSLSMLPLPSEAPAAYTYAPQRPVQLPSKAPTVNLSAQWLDVDGAVTSYSWLMAADGSAVPQGSITGTNGRFSFDNPDLGMVRCEMSHPLFPDFKGADILTTTSVQTAAMPTHVFATFTTLADSVAVLTMAAKANNSTVYVDWVGDGIVDQYTLTTTYTRFPVETHAGATVKCYSYDENDGLTVFSLSGARLGMMDASPMNELIHFTCTDGGLDDGALTLPSCKPTLLELVLDGNNLTTFDTSGFNMLKMLNLSRNKLTSFDASALPTLTNLYLADNELTSVTISNPLLWELALVRNNLESVDLSKMPAMEQLYLSYNKLSTLDVTDLPELRFFYIDNNRFTFATLPQVNNGVIKTYVYANQEPLTVEPVDGCVVDLSSQKECYGARTVYTWYIDSPYYDEEGNLVGENLYEDEEYTLVDGVTTFLKPFNHIMCVMTNPAMPGLVLYTNFIDVAPESRLDEAVASDDLAVRWFNLSGICVAETAPGEKPALTPGIYVRLTSRGATKVMIGY